MPPDQASAQVAVEEVLRHLSLRNTTDGEWVNTKGLLFALHPRGTCIAVAHRNELSIFAVHGAIPTYSHGSAANMQNGDSSILAQCNNAVYTSQSAAGPHTTNSQQAPDSQSQVKHARGLGSQQEHQPGAHVGSATTGDADVTHMMWVMLHMKTQHSDTDSRSITRDNSRQSSMSAARLYSNITDAQPGSGAPTETDSQRQLYSTILVVIDSAGYIQLHDDRGHPLFRQKLHQQPLKHVAVRYASDNPWTNHNRQTSSKVDGEIVITGTGCIMQISIAELATAWQGCCDILQLQAARAGKQTSAFGALFGWTDPPLPQVNPLQCQRWDLPKHLHSHTLAICMGSPAAGLYNILRGQANQYRHNSSSTKAVITAGPSSAVWPPTPCLASLELRSGAARAGLTAAIGAGFALASDILQVARNATGTVVNGPAAITRGIKNFVMAPLFSAGKIEKWSQALVTHDDPSAGLGAAQPSPGLLGSFHDPPRAITCVAAAPSGSLLATCDTLGRVLLIDGSTMVVIRMWKGYRDAVCCWTVVAHSSKDCHSKAATHSQQQQWEQTMSKATNSNHTGVGANVQTSQKQVSQQRMAALPPASPSMSADTCHDNATRSPQHVVSFQSNRDGPSPQEELNTEFADMHMHDQRELSGSPVNHTASKSTAKFDGDEDGLGASQLQGVQSMTCLPKESCADGNHLKGGCSKETDAIVQNGEYVLESGNATHAPNSRCTHNTTEEELLADGLNLPNNQLQPTHHQSQLLLVYAPKRHVVEGWLAPHGRCVLSMQVSPFSKLLSTSTDMSAVGSSCQTGPGAYLLDGVTGVIHDLRAAAEQAVFGRHC